MIIRKSYQHKIGELGEEKKGWASNENELLLYCHNTSYSAIRCGDEEMFFNFKIGFDDSGEYVHGECLKYEHQKEPKGTVVTLQQE